MTEEEKEILKHYVLSITTQKAHLKQDQEEIARLIAEKQELRKEGKDSLNVHFGELQNARSRVNHIQHWLADIAAIRREVLLHLHRDKLEEMGLEYPEIPSFIDES